MKKRNKLVRCVCACFVLISVLTVFVGAQTSVEYMENIGISYTDNGMVSLSDVSSDPNIRGLSGAMTVTMTFNLYTDGETDWFAEGYRLVEAGVLNKYDFLSIGHPNQLLYDSIELIETDEVYFNRLYAAWSYEPDYIPNSPYFEYVNDRDLYFYRHKIAITYRQNATLPSVQNTDYYDGIPFAMTNDYVYSGSQRDSFNMVFNSKYIGETRQFYYEPIEISVKPGTPKSVSYSGDENETVIYSVCTYFDIYNLWFKYLYNDEPQYLPSNITDAVYKSTIDVDLRNSYNIISSSENDRYPGGMGWSEPFDNFDYYESLRIQDAYSFNYLTAHKVTFSPARNTEYWVDSVSYKNLYTNANLDPSTRYVLFYGEFNYYDREDPDGYLQEEMYYDVFYNTRPYIGVWTSHDISSSYDVTYDGTDVAGVDVSGMYVDIKFNMPEWGDIDESTPVRSFIRALAQFFEGFLRALLEVTTSVLYNAFVWICMESPFISDLIGPLFQAGTVLGKLLFQYIVPIMGSMGVFGCIVGVPFLITCLMR